MNDELPYEDQAFERVLNLTRRPVTEEQIRKFEGYAAEIFNAFGMDLETPATHDTPRRFIQALFEATDGYDGDPKLLKTFTTECRGDPDCHLAQVIEGPINFFSFCEHHALPFYGQAYVGYIAHENIIGISKLTRLVRIFAKRFAVQERIGQQVADTLEAMLHPHGVAVISLYPGLVRTESVMQAAAFLDLSNSESPQFIGRAVAALAADSGAMKRTGTVCLAAALGPEYGFRDIDGKQPKPLTIEDV